MIITQTKLWGSVQWCGWPEFLTPNCGQMWVKKRTKTTSIYVHKLDFIALIDCFWVTWHSGGEKMFNP